MNEPLPVTAVATFTLTGGDAPEPLDALLADATDGRRFRRINRFIQLALIGAHRCRRADGAQWPARQPIVIATGQGGVAATAAMLEGVVAAGQLPMPFQFINLVGNMAGFHVANSLGAVAANSAVSRLDFPLESALAVARQDYAREGCALLGAVDELAWPLAAHRRRLGVGADVAVGEGSHWLRLGTDRPPLGWIEDVRYLNDDDALLDYAKSQQDAALICAPAAHRRLAAAGIDLAARSRSASERFPVHDTMAGAVLCDFLENGGGGRLVHVSAAQGRYAAIVVSGA